MVEITGNTYPVRDALRALGGRPVKRGSAWVWLVPDEKEEEARRLVEAAPKRPRCGGVKSRQTYRVNRCETCRIKINYGSFCGRCEFGR